MFVITALSSTSDAIATTGDRSPSVLLTVLGAGLSVAIGQSIILFINRVKPGRFVLSLGIQAVIFTFGYFFLSLSTWFVGKTFFETTLTYATVANIVGLSYGPLRWAFLSAMPYLGEPIFFGLSLWSFLLVLTNFSTQSSLGLWSSFWCVVLGWFVLRLTRQTIGYPLTALGERLLNRVAGLELATDPEELANIVATGRASSPASTPSSKEVRDGQTDDITDDTTEKGPVETVETNVTPEPPISPVVPPIPSIVSPQPQEREASQASGVQSVSVNKERSWFDRGINQVFGLLGLAIAIGLSAILLATVGKLVTIAFIIIVSTAVLSPLEALGWWAGWFGDGIETARNPGTVLEAVPAPSNVSRYALYLDGIGQSSNTYDSLVNQFLTKLAASLPDDIVLISGFMPYSILNIPLTGNRIFSSFWRWVDQEQKTNPGSKWSFAVYLKNMFIVALSADRRYGPIYSQGMAQLIYNSLVKYGYQLGSGVPVTLIGYSGGGQISMATLPFLKQALGASVEVISLAGVLSGNTKAIALEHLYHLAGEKDSTEQLGPLIFPKRKPIFFLSYWNRAKRRGQISEISLGPVGHNGPEGVLDAGYYLPDGRSSLQQTLDWISGIVSGKLRIEIATERAKSSNYERFRQAEFNQLQYYPLDRSVDPELYRPIAPWMGRLILPEPDRRQTVKGVLFEVHHAPQPYQHLVGQVVYLRWSDSPQVKEYVRSVTRDVHFSDNAEYSSRVEGLIHPTRLNRWRQVDPLESLAGARPDDDLLVMLRGPVSIEEAKESGDATAIEIDREPVQISGRYYGLVKIIQPVGDLFEVVHFNRQSRQFDGTQEIVQLPQVVADDNDTLPATNQDLEKSPLNPMGWYIYGAPDSSGQFVVQAIAPRALFRIQPESTIGDRKAALEFIKKETWDNLPAQKGKIQSVLLCPQSQTKEEAVQEWQEGDRALLLHVYGGIGGNKIEPAAKSPVYFGHFAYGYAQVIRDPLSDELRFEIEYHQVYTHNVRGLISGTMHWSAYMGDRQWGFLGTRPVCDLLVKLDTFTADFDFEGVRDSALSEASSQLEAMMARYRIGDGTGGTYVGPANNCSQDSNQAMYAALRNMENLVKNNQTWLEQWEEREPEQAQRFEQLLEIKNALKWELMPFGSARADWEEGTYNLGSVLEDRPLKNLSIGLASWRTLLPRLASDTIVKIFLDRGATVWVLRTNQVGGCDPDIEPLAPMTL